MTKYLLLFILFASCTQQVDKVKSIVLKDKNSHEDNIRIIQIKRQMKLLESDSISNTMELLKNVSSMKEVRLKNELDHLRDSFIIETRMLNAMMEDIKSTPLKCTLYDTVLVKINIRDTTHIYDTIPIYQDRKGLFHIMKEAPKPKQKRRDNKNL